MKFLVNVYVKIWDSTKKLKDMVFPPVYPVVPVKDTPPKKRSTKTTAKKATPRARKTHGK